MKKIFIFILLAPFGFVKAQQLQTSSFYALQGIMHNPSIIGTQQEDVLGINYKNQWMGIDGAPKTLSAFGSFNLTKQKLGLGGLIYNDQTGATSRNGLSLTVAKHIVLKNDAIISLGIENRLQQFIINKSKLIDAIGADPAIVSANSSVKYDASFGISYTNKNLQLGASVAQMLQSRLQFYTGNLNRNAEARLYRHYYLHGNYKIKSNDERTTVIPNFMLIYFPNAPAEFQAGFQVMHKDLIWVGVGGRANQNANFSAGLKLNKNLAVDYVFDLYTNPTNEFGATNNGHEFMLRYLFTK